MSDQLSVGTLTVFTDQYQNFLLLFIFPLLILLTLPKTLDKIPYPLFNGQNLRTFHIVDKLKICFRKQIVLCHIILQLDLY